MQRQRVFRGWRTRRRVVHQVRRDVELLAADIRRQLAAEWALLGPAATAAPFALDWGPHEQLRLPRTELALFGVAVRVPPEPEPQDAGEDELASPDKPAIAPRESAFEKQPPADASGGGEAVGAQGPDGHGIRADSGTRDARVSAVEIRGTARQAETSAADALERRAENMDRAPQRGEDGNTQLAASVQEILATHSREDIVLELQWARQALRDRRKYLRSKKRVERSPDALACA